jgi:uncharacterized protein YlxP (DUF503 family)
MVVGILRVDLLLPGNHSLKEKRHTLKRIKESVKSRFNVSVAEVDHHDLWQRAVMGVVAVDTVGAHANSVLDQVLDHIEGYPEAEVVNHEIEIMNC